MHFLATLENRPRHWYVDVPALACGSPIADVGRAEEVAAALVTTAIGMPRGEFSISVEHLCADDTAVSIPWADVDVLHRDGAWHAGHQSAWLRLRDGSWRALVCYAVDGVIWERPVHAESARPRPATHAVVPRPRTGLAAIAAA